MLELIKTKDGSNTLYSKKYQQYFHDIDTGAIQEALTKHVIPCLQYHQNKKILNILDICFGLGYNTFSTIYYVLKQNLKIKLHFYSPELDEDLIKTLNTFIYPKEFDCIKHIINSLYKTRKYEDENIKIELFIGDAREYIKNLKDMDIVYQDAFSSDVNTELWSVEYFEDIYKACKEDVILSTYSVATNVRLSLYKSGFYIYEIRPIKKKQTLAFKRKLEIEAKYIDMELKQQRNKDARAIYDKPFS